MNKQITLRGVVIRGLGYASTGSLPKQWIALMKAAPDIKDCRQGTINLLMERPVVIRGTDIDLGAVAWGNTVEDIGLIPILISTGKQRATKGFAYYAARSPHRLNPALIEVICPNIPGIKAGVECFITLSGGRDIGYAIVY